MTRTQTLRTIGVATPLGEDVLLFRSLSLTDSLGRPFQGELDVLSENPAIDFAAIVGQNVTIRLDKADGSPRFFNAYVSRFAQTKNLGLLARYQATLVPWLWFLTRTSDCKIFQNQSVPDIIKEIFKDNGFTDVIDNLSGTYTPWEYCVQFRETDFNFVSRLMEHEGIYYFFEHEDGKHSIVLADAPGAHQPYPGYEEIAYRSVADQADREHIYDWTVEKTVQPGQYTLNDYDFKVPRKALVANSQIQRDNAEAGFEMYDYPGDYIQPGDGSEYTKVRIQELQAQYEVVSGTSDAMGLSTGYTFKLTDFPREDQAREYLVTSAVYHLTSDEYDTAAGEEAADGEGPAFTCEFKGIDAEEIYRSPRLTPKPIVNGPQTAVVVGPAGEEIYTDEFGRVKVQFHWDRYGKNDENSSCWIRVCQTWAGKQFGAVHLPRIGQEIIVHCLQGDPDLPIIIGRVYNGDQRVPYPLPGQKNVSGFKTNSTKGGGGSNELSMDDTKGSEKFTIHAQKDMGTTVENNDSQTVKSDRSITVNGKHSETIKKDTTITITDGPMRIDVAKNTFTHHVNKDVTEWFDANQRTHVFNNVEITSGNAQIILNAKSEVRLVCGQSMISLKPEGTIVISGVDISVSGASKVAVGVGNQNATFDVSKSAIAGAQINSSAVGMHEIAGAVVKIN